MRKLTAYGPSIIVAATAALVLVAGPIAVQQLTYAQTHARIVLASERLQHDNILEQINQAYRDIATFVEPAVVHISAQRIIEENNGQLGTGALSTGSGWIYDDRGHIVTNHHVVDGAHRIEVQLYTGELRPAEIVGFDRSTDIAVLKIPSGRLHPAVRRGPEAPVRQGDMVFAFGSPFDFRFSMSSGVVSGQGRSVGVIRDEFGRRSGYENFIQVDAAINPGNSGGPLTDFRGHVIGMNTAIATGPRRPYEESQFAGVGLAIPMEMIEPVVTQLITTGEVRKGFLGVSILDRTEPVGMELRVRGFEGGGVQVARIDPNLPADVSGIRSGDVITRINGRDITSVEHLLRIAREMMSQQDENGSTAVLTLWRFDSDVNRGSLASAMVPLSFLGELRGISLIERGDPIARRLEMLGFTGRGVPVVRLDPAGPAVESGLLPGDVLTHVNDRPVGHVDQVRSVISSMLPDATVNLRVWRYDPTRDRGEAHDLQVTLAQLDPLRMSGTLPQDQRRDAIPELGIGRMSTATQELADRYATTFHPGVMLEELVPGSSLAEQIAPGSILTRVMDRPVTDVDEFIQALRFANLVQRGVRVLIIEPDGSRVATILRVE